jgi:hypothetical protein
MPFTLAHPAAVVPITRFSNERLALSALVIGSMAPDFQYLLPGRPGRYFGHTVPGLFFFCLPLGLAALALFHGVVKGPVLLLLPDTLRGRLSGGAAHADRLTVPRLLWISGLIVLGALTHLAWDAVTHEHAAGVRAIALLRAPVLRFPGVDVRVYALLQFGSTLAGLGLLSYWVWAWVRRQPAGGRPETALPTRVRLGLSATLLASTLLLSMASGITAAIRAEGLRRLQVFVVHSAVTGMRALAFLLLIYALSFMVVARYINRRDARGGSG